MTEQQIKFICKWIVQNSNRSLSELDKEILKQAIDNAKNVDDLVIIALSMLDKQNDPDTSV